jgi:hypothetical protein
MVQLLTGIYQMYNDYIFQFLVFFWLKSWGDPERRREAKKEKKRKEKSYSLCIM